MVAGVVVQVLPTGCPLEATVLLFYGYMWAKQYDC